MIHVKARLPLGLLTTAMLLNGCGQVRETLGLDRTPPDEFSIMQHAPLSLPPEYNLRPPVPNARHLQHITSQERARDALGSRPSTSKTGSLSASEETLLRSAGAEKASSNIKSQIEQESTISTATEPSLIDKVVGRHPTSKLSKDEVINPVEEQKSLKKAQ